MRYYVVRCGYSYEFRFSDPVKAGAFIAGLAENLELDHEKVANNGFDSESFDLVVCEDTDPEIEEPEVEEIDPEEVSENDNV